MENKRTLKGKVAVEYLDKHPTAFTRSLARKMFEENGALFYDIEDARSTLRYYRGAAGEKARKKLADSKYKDIWANIELPEGIEEPRQDFIMPVAQDNVLLLSDIHVPYHDANALRVAVNWGKEKGINTVILNGDIVDFYAISSFVKDPRKIDFVGELDTAYEVIYWIKEQLPDAVFYFLPGNHEARFEKYMRVSAPRLLDTDEFRLDILLRFGEFGIHMLKYKQLIRVGKLIIGHGDEISRGGGGVNPARSFFLKAKSNYMGGHFHRSSSHSEHILDGKQVKSWSVGCLCGLTPEYMPYNNWNHGFARIKQFGGGEFEVFNAEIVNGKRITG